MRAPFASRTLFILFRLTLCLFPFIWNYSDRQMLLFESDAPRWAAEVQLSLKINRILFEKRADIRSSINFDMIVVEI